MIEKIFYRGEVELDFSKIVAISLENHSLILAGGDVWELEEKEFERVKGLWKEVKPVRSGSSRLINLNYTISGINFCALIDCNWSLHNYYGEDTAWESKVPIEILCYDFKDWGIRKIYQEGTNEQSSEGRCFTAVDYDNILKETDDWIKEKIKEMCNE